MEARLLRAEGGACRPSDSVRYLAMRGRTAHTPSAREAL